MMYWKYLPVDSCMPPPSLYSSASSSWRVNIVVRNICTRSLNAPACSFKVNAFRKSSKSNSLWNTSFSFSMSLYMWTNSRTDKKSPKCLCGMPWTSTGVALGIACSKQIKKFISRETCGRSLPITYLGALAMVLLFRVVLLQCYNVFLFESQCSRVITGPIEVTLNLWVTAEQILSCYGQVCY